MENIKEISGIVHEAQKDILNLLSAFELEVRLPYALQTVTEENELGDDEIVGVRIVVKLIDTHKSPFENTQNIRAVKELCEKQIYEHIKNVQDCIGFPIQVHTEISQMYEGGLRRVMGVTIIPIMN